MNILRWLGYVLGLFTERLPRVPFSETGNAWKDAADVTTLAQLGYRVEAHRIPPAQMLWLEAIVIGVLAFPPYNHSVYQFSRFLKLLAMDGTLG